MRRALTWKPPPNCHHAGLVRQLYSPIRAVPGVAAVCWRDWAGSPTFECPGNGSYAARVRDWQGRVATEVLSQLDPRQTMCGQSFADDTTRSAYEAFGMMGGTTLHLGAAHRYFFDNLGRLVGTESPGVNTTRRAYSSAGQLVADTITFDDGARVARRYEYNRRGQRTVVRDTVMRTTGAGIGGGRIEHNYDAAGRPTSLIGYRENNTYFAGAAFYQDRGGRDTLRVVSVWGDVNWLLATRWSYNAAGIMTHTWTETPGVASWYSFNRTSSDALDRVRSATYSEPAPSGGPNLSGTATFGYDTTNGTGRLLFNSQSGTLGTTSTWTYDVLGNRVTEVCSSAWSSCDNSETVTFGTDNRMVRRLRNGVDISRFWTDRTGNRLARVDSTTAGANLGPQELMSYTARNQLFFSMTPTASPANYDYNWHWYDASGLRVVTHVGSGSGWIPPAVGDTSSGVRTYYVYDGSDVALTLTRAAGAWSVHQRFVNGGVDQPLAVRSGGIDLGLVTDHQGSVRAAIKVNGVRETNASYWTRNAFGALQGAGAAGGVQTQTGYTGASTPNASGGFTYLRNRWYDPQTGRFLTQDPIGLAGGVNLYAYAGNNPISFSDPFGLCEPLCSAVDAALLADDIQDIRENGLSAGNLAGVTLGALCTATPILTGCGAADEVIGAGARAVSRGVRAVGRGIKVASARRAAVRTAWRQEADLVRRTGVGTRDWTDAEIGELVETGKVRGYDGHHINSVNGSPEMAGDPNNIEFVRRGTEHLGRHGGDFRNPTTGSPVRRE